LPGLVILQGLLNKQFIKPQNYAKDWQKTKNLERFEWLFSLKSYGISLPYNL
jgi:hypothetical protein